MKTLLPGLAAALCAMTFVASAQAQDANPKPNEPARAEPRFGPRNTAGWSMMTPEERRAHHDRMMGFQSPDECRAYMDEHRKLMAERAKERGVKLRDPRYDMCGNMQRRGMGMMRGGRGPGGPGGPGTGPGKP